jgi:hypothetical protein
VGEKKLENELVRKLREGCQNADALETIRIVNSTSSMSSIGDLCGDIPYEIYQDTSMWNIFPTLMVDVIGNMTPDIVVRSRVSGQNRKEENAKGVRSQHLTNKSKGGHC